MIKREPYIGMPIILGEYDDIQTSQSCDENNTAESMEKGCIDNYKIAMAYVPWQKWNKPYEIDEGFKVGTIFPELNLPFLGYRGGMAR